jgi:hypothetical protein
LLTTHSTVAMLAFARYSVLYRLTQAATPVGTVEMSPLRYCINVIGVACAKCCIWLTGSYATRSITARVPTHEDDTHEDFKPKFNPDAEPRSASSVVEQIEQDVKQHPVFLYMKVQNQDKEALHACSKVTAAVLKM